MRKTIVGLLALLVALVGTALVAPQLTATATASATLETGTPLPAVPAGMTQINLGLDGAWAYAGLRALPDAGSGPLTIYRTASDGTDDSWTAVIDPLTSQPLQDLFLPQINEGRILVAGPDDANTPCPEYRIFGTATRNFSSCLAPRLVRGGRLLLGPSGGPWRLETNGGTLLGTYPTYPVVDGDRVWWLTASPRQVVGQDLSTGDPVGPLPVPSNCGANPNPQAGGGYVLVPCSTSGGSALLDAVGTVPAYRLVPGIWRVGAGFAAHVVYANSSATVDVVDFGQGKITHQFATSSISRNAVDSDGSARVIFETPELGVAVGDIGTLAPRNVTSDDVTPPTVSMVTTPGAYRKPAAGSDTLQLDYGWSGADPGFPNTVRYDTREANYYITDQQPYYDLLKNTTTTTYSSQADARYTRVNCFQVRARDWAGNESDWTSPTCTVVDGEAPWVEWTKQTFEPFSSHLSSTPVRVSWHGVDDGGLATSRLLLRLAPPGEAAGSWYVPWGWNALTTTSASRTFRAGTTACFRVQMRDRAGNISSSTFAGSQCVTIPYDDRSFTAVGPAYRGRSSLLLGGTYTRLAATNAWLVRKGVRMRAVDLRVNGDWTTHPRVYLGDKEITPEVYSSYSDSKWHWVRYYFGRTLTGTLRIRGDKYRPVIVDAIAVEH